MLPKITLPKNQEKNGNFERKKGKRKNKITRHSARKTKFRLNTVLMSFVWLLSSYFPVYRLKITNPPVENEIHKIIFIYDAREISSLVLMTTFIGKYRQNKLCLNKSKFCLNCQFFCIIWILISIFQNPPLVKSKNENH